MKSIFFSPFTLAVSAVLLVGFHSLSASWTPPTATPPGDNVPPVVNTGSTTQNKAGNFMANIVAAATSTWSPRYCDELGNNCFTPSTLAGSGGWVSANQLVYNGSIVGSGTGDTGGVDLNLASVVGARETLVQLQVTTSDNTTNSFVFKPKGVAGVQGSTVGSGVGAGAAGLQLFGTANRMGYVTVTTNASGVVLMQSYTNQTVQVRLVGYIGGVTSTSTGGGLPSYGPLYQCPRSFGCSNGTPIVGAWASYGCVGQISNLSTCMQVWNNGASQSCTNACTPISF